jgi:hypothetical protein
LIYHAWVNMLFYCDKHPLHLRICLLPPLALTLFWVLFFPILQRGPNDEGQTQKHLLLARRRRFLLSFLLLYSSVVCTNTTSRHFFIIQDLTSSIDADRIYVEQKFLVNWSSSSPSLSGDDPR